MKSNLASATSVIALLAFEAGHGAAPLITLATGAVTAATALTLDSTPAVAGPITFTGPNSVGATYSGGTLTIYDLVDGVTTGAARTAVVTYSSSNTSGSKVSVTANALAASGFNAPATTLVLNANTARSNSVTYSYTASSVGSASNVRVFNWTTTNASNQPASLTLVGSGVAPVAGMGVTNPYVLVNDATSGVQVTITNSGTGNKAAPVTVTGATLNNLNGSIGTVSGFSGGGSSVALGDAYGGPSSTQSYFFTPTSLTTKGQTFTGSAVATFRSGFGATNVAGSLTATLTGTGVAPVQGVGVANNSATAAGANLASGNVGYILVGNTSTVTVTVTNTGDGNKSGTATNAGGEVISNLRGSFGSAGSSIFAGGGSSVSLADSASTTTTYVFTPTARGGTTTTVSTVFSDGSTDGKNTASTLVTTLTGTGVAPVLGASGSASAGYVLVGQSANASVTITNTGDGNKSGLGTISNLRGSIGSVATSTFAGSASSISLGDTASSTYSYVYTPTTRGASSTSVVSTFSNGGTSNVATSATASLIGTGVAPVNAVASSSATFVRIGTTATATVSISNVGDGNLSGAGTISNLRGSVGTSLGSGFTASISNPTSVSLADSVSTTLGFTYTPVSHGSASSTVTFSLANGNTSGSNAAQTVTASVSATGVGPQYQSTFGTVNTPTAGASGAVSGATPPTISFGSVGINTKYTTYLNISNITTDANGGNAALTNLTLNSYTLSGVDASKFSVSLTPGTVVSKGGSVLIPIAVQGTSLGALSSTLTIFTDQGVALGGTGDTFTYNLTAVIPEPASMAVLGAGLAGLAFMRRRRKA